MEPVVNRPESHENRLSANRGCASLPAAQAKLSRRRAYNYTGPRRGTAAWSSSSSVRWENSNNPEYIEPARSLSLLRISSCIRTPKVTLPRRLSPFGGGGAIPLECRLGCDSVSRHRHQSGGPLDPALHRRLSAEVRPARQPPSARLHQAACSPQPINEEWKDTTPLFGKGKGRKAVQVAEGEVIPDVEITEAEYCNNPLAADVKYWASWVEREAHGLLRSSYPCGPDGAIPIAYLWARSITCTNPAAKEQCPLYNNFG